MPDATIVVLGAGPGMGRAVAHRFGTAGFRVALVARCSSRLDVLRAEVVRDGIDGRRPRPLQRGRRPASSRPATPRALCAGPSKLELLCGPCGALGDRRSR